MAIRATTITTTTTASKNPLAWLLCLPAVALGYFGYVHFVDGIAVNAAVPVPVYMVAQIPMPKAAYAAAATTLAQANARNGNAKLLRAEAWMHSGAQPAESVSSLSDGVSRAPASSRGWILLSEALYPASRTAAARALSQSLLLAPYDFWLAGPQTADAARLWPYLDGEAREEAIAKSRLLWEEPALRPYLKGVLDRPEGAALLTKALSAEERRALNRWIFSTGSQRSMP